MSDFNSKQTGEFIRDEPSLPAEQPTRGVETSSDAKAVEAAISRRGAPIKLGTILGYASGQLVEVVVGNTLVVFLLFYVTTACGLPGGLAGIAISAGLVVDAVMDPFIGSLSDGWRSRLGRRLPFMLTGIAPIAVTFFLVFSLPARLNSIMLTIWLSALLITLRISLSVFVLPYQAVGAELSEDFSERSSIMTWRWGVGQLGTLLALVLGFGVFLGGKNGLSNRAAYLPFSMTLAAIFTLGALVAAKTVHGALDRQHRHPTSNDRFYQRLLKDLGEVKRHRSFQILFVGALILFVSLGVFNSLGLHANSFFWKLNATQTQWVTTSLFGGLLAGTPFAGPMLARFEKRTILVVGFTALGVAQGLPTTLRLLGWLPLTGIALAVLLSSIMFVAGALLAVASIAILSMMADSADEHEYLFGFRREGLIFAGLAFANKAAMGAGALISGIILQAIDFPTDLAAHGGMATVLPAKTVFFLGLSYGPGSALLTFAATVIGSQYRLDRRAHAGILTKLSSRRAEVH